MTDAVKTSEKVEQKMKTKCPKGMKLPTSIKRMAAGMRGATKAERRDFMRAMGRAIHDAAYKLKNANKAAGNTPRSAAVTPAAE